MRQLLLIFYLVFGYASVFAQVQEQIDSLKIVLSNQGQGSIQRLETLKKILILVNDPEETIYYGEKLVEESGAQNQKGLLRRGHTSVGGGHLNLGNLSKALEAYVNAIQAVRETSDDNAEGHALLNIGGIYYEYGEYLRAKNYLNQGLKVFKSLSNNILIGKSYVRFGYTYYALNSFDTALVYLDSADYHLSLADGYFKEMLGVYGKVARALSFAGLNEIEKAEKLLPGIYEAFEENEIYIQIAYTQVELAKAYRRQGLSKKALELFENSYLLSIKYGFKNVIQDASKHLSEIYKSYGNFEKALEYQSTYHIYRDSLINAEQIQKMADLRTEYEVGQKQAEVDLLTTEKRNQQIIIYATTGGGLLILSLLGLVFKNNRDKSKINKQLEVQKRQLQSLNKSKDKFFSIISHDLRGPVSAFAGVSRLIKGALKNNDKEGLLEVANEIDYSVDHLSGLLDNLLNWAMQQQGHFPNVPEKLEINSLIEQTAGVFSNMADGKSILLKVNAPDQLFIWADQNSTMTILRNLISNALKFTQEGGEVTVESRQRGEMAVIEIADNGLGMSQSTMENLFKLNGRKSAFGTAGEKGLGLGLQLVYEFVEMNNGAIKVESEEGNGTKFIVRLPLFDEVSERVLV